MIPRHNYVDVVGEELYMKVFLLLKIVRFGVQNEAKPEKPMTDGEITATYGLGYSTRICIEL